MNPGPHASIDHFIDTGDLDHVRVKPGFVGLLTVNVAPGSSPNNRLSIVAIAPLITVCPEVNSGKGGVGTRETHAGSGDVDGLSSRFDANESSVVGAALIGTHR